MGDETQSSIVVGSPATRIPTDDPTEKPAEGVALCLSGSYRAMVFHLGILIRLNELGLLIANRLFSYQKKSAIFNRPSPILHARLRSALGIIAASGKSMRPFAKLFDPPLKGIFHVKTHNHRT